MEYNSTNNNGFTLAELVVVIFIIGVLAAIAIPSYNDYRAKATPIALTSPVIVDGIERQLTAASVAIGAPSLIARGEEKKVYVILDVKKEINDLFALLPSDYQTHGAEVKVSNRMQAILSSQDFSISNDTPETQAVGADKAAKWQWSIKPKPNAEGESELVITISALVPVQGQPTPIVLDTYSREIFVSVSAKSKAWGFLQENMGWLWAPILAFIGFIKYLLNHRKKRSANIDQTSNNGINKDE